MFDPSFHYYICRSYATSQPHHHNPYVPLVFHKLLCITTLFSTVIIEFIPLFIKNIYHLLFLFTILRVRLLIFSEKKLYLKLGTENYMPANIIMHILFPFVYNHYYEMNE